MLKRILVNALIVEAFLVSIGAAIFAALGEWALAGVAAVTAVTVMLVGATERREL